MHTEQAYKHCKMVIEKHSKTFSKAFQHLPKAKRQAVWAVYAFCRTADDLVDEGTNQEEDLDQFEQELMQFEQGAVPRERLLWTALSDTFSRFDFDLKPFYDMIAGQRMDLRSRSYTSVEEVLDYSYHVASTVGLMLLPILAPGKENDLRPSAIKLGYAMQLTNILRDVGEDIRLGRKYLPDDLMKEYGYTREMLEAGIVNESFVQVWERLATLAESFYQEGLQDIHLYSPAARLPVQAAAYFYREILQTARNNRYDVFKQRAVVSTETKQHILSGLALSK
ncbi:phytoene/squalene synthase family protein [Bacillus daqingensis]|uniref:Phytoene/squalene synthase family protein n=1 Tax=Bacillus daqingensis TaxID=872396 RepID=A0ABV9NXJ8_9BACI